MGGLTFRKREGFWLVLGIYIRLTLLLCPIVKGSKEVLAAVLARQKGYWQEDCVQMIKPTWEICEPRAESSSSSTVFSDRE